MISFNDRVLVLGSTGSGKSEVLNYLAAGVRCQRLLLDTKDEFLVPGLEPVSSVDAIDWSQRTVHVRPPATVVPTCTSKTKKQPDCGHCFDCIFRAAYYAPNALTVVVHELGDVCEYNAGRTPKWFNAYVSKGRARSKGIYMGSQRPASIPTRAIGESEHVLMVGERFIYPADHQRVAEAIGQDPRELAPMIDQVQHELGQPPDKDGRTHAYLWFRRKLRNLVACPPLPDAHRAAIDVQRSLEPSSAHAAEHAAEGTAL